MSFEIRQQVATGIERPIADAEQATTPHQQAERNSVTPADQSQQSSGSTPTDGAREATPTKTPGYKEIKQMTEERLKDNPEYVELKEKYETWKSLENDFALIDQYTGFITGDGTLTLDNLRALANDMVAPNPAAKAAAQRLLANMEVWNALAKGDNVVGTHDVTEFVNGMKSQLKAIEDATKNEIKAEVGAAAAAAAAAGGTPAAGSPADPATNQTGAAPLFKAPALSSKPGMEGAVENVGNTLSAIANATSELMAKLADPNLKPEDRQKLQAQYNELQQLQSMLTAMYTQLQEAIANLMKMYSDVAKNSIQNMR